MVQSMVVVRGHAHRACLELRWALRSVVRLRDDWTGRRVCQVYDALLNLAVAVTPKRGGEFDSWQGGLPCLCDSGWFRVASGPCRVVYGLYLQAVWPWRRVVQSPAVMLDRRAESIRVGPH